MDGRVSADHVVVREHVVVAELVCALTVGPHRADIWPDLSLWKNHTDLHEAHDIYARWLSPVESDLGAPVELAHGCRQGPNEQERALTGTPTH
jgi:hypothetical protein